MDNSSENNSHTRNIQIENQQPPIINYYNFNYFFLTPTPDATSSSYSFVTPNSTSNLQDSPTVPQAPSDLEVVDMEIEDPALENGCYVKLDAFDVKEEIHIIKCEIPSNFLPDGMKNFEILDAQKPVQKVENCPVCDHRGCVHPMVCYFGIKDCQVLLKKVDITKIVKTKAALKEPYVMKKPKKSKSKPKKSNSKPKNSKSKPKKSKSKTKQPTKQLENSTYHLDVNKKRNWV